jgi:hypothetical protein
MLEWRARVRFGAPGKISPAVFASSGPRPQLLRNFTKESGHVKVKDQNQNPPMATSSPPSEGSRPMLSSEPAPSSPRPWATAPGATPARLIEHTMGGSNGRSKPELSTLLRTGSFYFALTWLSFSVDTAEPCHVHWRLRDK